MAFRKLLTLLGLAAAAGLTEGDSYQIKANPGAVSAVTKVATTDYTPAGRSYNQRQRRKLARQNPHLRKWA